MRLILIEKIKEENNNKTRNQYQFNINKKVFNLKDALKYADNKIDQFKK